MATYREIENAKAEKHQQKLHLKLFYIAGTLLISFFFLVMLGFKPKETITRNISSTLYYLKEYFSTEINTILFIKHYLAALWRYTINFLHQHSLIDNFTLYREHIEKLYMQMHSQTYFYNAPPMSIAVNLHGNGSHIIYSFFIFYGLALMFYLVFLGKESQIKRYLFFFLTDLFFGVLQPEEKRKFSFRGNWFELFKREMFQRSITIVDGYQRAKHLQYLKDHDLILAGDKYVVHYGYLRKLFLSNEQFYDLFLIIEGYMTKPKKQAKSIIDNLLSLISNKEKINIDNQPYLFDKAITLSSKQDFYNYKCFNNIDEVTFSADAIRYCIDIETENYIKILRNKFFKGRSSAAKQFQKYLNNFQAYPERNTKMLFGINNQNKTIYEYDTIFYKAFQSMNQEGFNPMLVSKRVEYVFTAYFRFILFREIIQKYMNLPAGTIVVKVDDYTLRMILDSYEEQKIIHIEKNKNDSSNKGVESDYLSNLFNYSYWYYSKNFSTTTLQDRISFHFNTDVIIGIEENIEKNIVQNYLKACQTN